MSTRFAGSRHLDERRRRRLAAHSEEEQAESYSSTERLTRSVKKSNRGSSEANVSHFPLRKLISEKSWKLWGIGLIGLLVGLALLRSASVATSPGSEDGSGFIRLFHPTNGQALRVYGSLLFLLSGQLAMLIWWVRSRSPLDFPGRYRVWTRIAAAGLVASLLLITEVAGFLREQLSRLTDVGRFLQPEFCLLIPLIGCAALFVFLMHQELRENRLSLVLLWTSAICGLILAWQSVSPAAVGLLASSELWGTGTALFGQLSLFMSLLFHTRHVIYVSADPPSKRTAKLRFRLPRLRISLPRLRKSKKVFGDETGDDFSLRNENETDEQKTKSDTRRRKELRKPGTPIPAVPSNVQTPSESGPSSESDADEPEGKDTSVQLEKSLNSLRVDEPLDKELLKGLSKRERRKLRKVHRRMQRSDRSRSSDEE